MKTIAIYRCLYGENFVKYSINSLIEHVDKIFIFWDDKPWGDITKYKYKNKEYTYPKQFDNIKEKILEINNPKIELIYDHQTTNINQFTHFVNDIIIPKYGKPEKIIVNEVDCVFKKENLCKAIKEFENKNYTCAKTRQVEIWRGFNYRIPERTYRTGAVFWNLKNLDKLPSTQRQAEGAGMKILSQEIHNLGFAVSPESGWNKHKIALGLTSIQFEKTKNSDYGGVNELWFENKWLNWNFKTNNKNLEMTRGYEYIIPYALEYNIKELPENIYKDIKLLRKKTLKKFNLEDCI